MNGIKQIFCKELSRVFKDRKMVFSVFILPVVIMIGIMSLTSGMAEKAAQDVENHTSVVYIENGPEGFSDFLEAAGTNCKIYPVENKEDVREKILSG